MAGDDDHAWGADLGKRDPVAERDSTPLRRREQGLYLYDRWSWRSRHFHRLLRADQLKRLDWRVVHNHPIAERDPISFRRSEQWLYLYDGGI